MKSSLSLAAIAATAIVGASNAALLYSNPWDGQYNAFASQNDTTGGGYGNFATCYGFFSTGGAQWQINDIHFVGAYFNPANQAPITAFTVQFWADNGSNAPGAWVGGQSIIAGGFSETYVGNSSYRYDMNIAGPIVSGDVWVSIVPDVAFPPQWGWNSGVDTDPAHAGWQVFFGSASRLAYSLNMDITGEVVPAPGAFALVGLAGICGRRRRA